nr:MAG TPA: hypothetical protein [Bacteriophage sp.]
MYHSILYYLPVNLLNYYLLVFLPLELLVSVLEVC